MKMKAEINWIIPDIMTNTSEGYFENEEEVSHESPQFFDEKDDERKWSLQIQSLRDYLYFGNGGKKYKVYLFVHLQQPPTSVFTATYFAVVSDEKEDQPRQIISEKQKHSPKFLDSNDDDIASTFVIGKLKEVKKLSTVSVHCTIEYETFDLKESDSPCKETESTITDVNQHSTGSVQQDLEKLLKHQSRSDICFIIDGQELRAHKLILSARSPVFTAMIDKAEAEDELMNSFKIDNTSFMTFKDLIHFIYTDQVVLSESNVDSLLAAAQEYLIPLLINKCEVFFYSTSLTVENCCEKFLIANANNADHLKKMVLDYIRSKSAKVMKTNGWIQLKKSHPDLASDVMEDIVGTRSS